MRQPAIRPANYNGVTNDGNGKDADLAHVDQNQPLICPSTGRVPPVPSRLEDLRRELVLGYQTLLPGPEV